MLPCGLPPMAKGSFVTILVTLICLSANGSKSSIDFGVVEALVVGDPLHLVQVTLGDVG